TGEEVPDHDAGEHRVADRVDEHRVLAQHDEHAGQRTGERGDHGEQGGACDEGHVFAPSQVSSRFSAARARRLDSTVTTMLRRGEASSETRKIANRVSTINGPVGTVPSRMDSQAPTPLPTAPKAADNHTMPRRVRVHWRAAAGGVTTKATISTSPTAFTPITVAITIVVNISVSITPARNPSAVLWSGSKVRRANSFQNSTISPSASMPTTRLVTKSAVVMTEALPNR